VSFRVVVHDDPDHTFEYVIALFSKELAIPESAALDLAVEINDEGHAVVRRMDDLPAARALEERLLSGGPDPRLARGDGSLIVSVEEVTREGDAVKVVSCGRVGPKGYEPMDTAARVRFQEDARRRAESALATVAGAETLAGGDDGPSEGLKLLMFILIAGGVVFALVLLLR